MFDNAALKAIKRVLVIDVADKNNQQGGDAQGPPRKKHRTSAAAAHAELGLGSYQSHFQTDRRDRTQNANNIATKLKQDLKEKDMLVDVLTLFDSKEKKHFDAVNKLKGFVGCHVVPFWVCRKQDKDKFRLFLRVFLPRYGHGFLGKKIDVHWATIEEKILKTVDLTQSAVAAKAEELLRRFRTVEQSIKDSTSVGVDEEPDDTNARMLSRAADTQLATHAAE